MRVLVCGGRDFKHEKLFKTWMLGAADLYGEATIIIHGGAKGADELASRWARFLCLPEFIFHANWDAHGKGAGPRRNQAMIDIGKPDVVVAFPGGKGTADMVRRARAAGVKYVVEVEVDDPCSTRAEGK